MTDRPAGGAGSEPEPEHGAPGEDPGYLIVTGEAAAEDGSVAEIVGGLPVAEGSAWDIGAPLADRGGGVGDEGDEGPARGRAGKTGR